MAKVSIGVVAVPQRLDMARALIAALDIPDRASISIDSMYQGSWYNTRKAWLSIIINSTHQITMEEDVMPCKNFIQTAEKIAELLPDEVISFYSSKRDVPLVNKANKQKIHWYKKDSVPSGQCVMMPVRAVYDFVRWCDRYVDASIATHEDENLWGWLQSTKRISYFTVPNLVQHMGEMRSALGWNSRGKNSPCFIGLDSDGLEIDWTLGLDCEVYHQNYTNEKLLQAYKGSVKCT